MYRQAYGREFSNWIAPLEEEHQRAALCIQAISNLENRVILAWNQILLTRAEKR